MSCGLFLSLIFVLGIAPIVHRRVQVKHFQFMLDIGRLTDAKYDLPTVLQNRTDRLVKQARVGVRRRYFRLVISSRAIANRRVLKIVYSIVIYCNSI
jgi:hypothetical protein